MFITNNNYSIYKWDPSGDTTSTIVVSPVVTTDYTLTVKNDVCEDIDMVRVVVNLDPTANATTDKDVCLMVSI